MSVHITLNQKKISEWIKSGDFDRQASEKKLCDSIRKEMKDYGETVVFSFGESYSISSADTMSALSFAANLVGRTLFFCDWLVEKQEFCCFPEFVECSMLTGETYSQVRDKFIRSGKSMSAAAFALQYKRRHMERLIREKVMNKHLRRCLYDCGDVGCANVARVGNDIVCEWFDKIEKMED